jgi:hypothetical protein
MPLSGNVPHFGGAIGDSPSGMSALSNEDLVRVNTETAKIISLPGECLFLMLTIPFSIKPLFLSSLTAASLP